MSPPRADHGHFHHQLLQAGFSVRLIFAIYLALSVAAAACSITALWAGSPEPMMFGLFLLLYVAWLGFIKAAPWIGVALPLQLRREREHLAH